MAASPSEYERYQQVVLVDYSLSQLQFAQEHYGKSDRFIYVAADAYNLPFRAGIFDGATMIRVIHHMAHVDDVLAQVRRVLTPGGMFILEHANKRNLKAMLRYALKRQSWNPYTPEPVEFVELNFDFHPEYMRAALKRAGFRVETRVPVSYLRAEPLKRALSPDLLVAADSVLQRSGLLYAPSVFIKSEAVGQGPNHIGAGALFACPDCGGDVIQQGSTIVCQREKRRWALRDGIYDFKAPLDSD
ncbi:MAG: methyltransferase domain-containing protein [Blastochloris sp.]|nr:methyltransferase domain-containing protein [Blastochloris sp.]